MNKLKKIGLTALATTLVSSAAYAGELGVSGSASLNYSGLDTNSDVNPWTMGDSVTFSGGGDLDNGMTVNVSYELDGGNYDDYSLKLGMGDSALTFSGNSVNAGGVDTVKDIVPTAYTPVYENADGTDNGLATTSGRVTKSMWGYAYSGLSDTNISIGYNAHPEAGSSSEASIGVTYTGIDGFTLAAGRFDDSEVAENDTYGVKYTMGSITAAYQITKVDYSAAATADQDADHVGVSIAVNENLSVSIGRQKVGIDLAVDDEVNTGLNASYTMGSITLGGGFNSVESAGGVQAADAEVAMLNASFAF